MKTLYETPAAELFSCAKDIITSSDDTDNIVEDRFDPISQSAFE